jgi:4-hydroxy-2-oxoheptanedioate aldolase
MCKDEPSGDLRERLSRGRVQGVFVKLPTLEAIDCVLLARLDFAVLDLEHSGIDERSLFHQLAYGRALRLPCLVRVARVDAAFVNRLLEAGAAGIQVPDVTRRSQVEALIAATRFPPDGERGVSTTHRAAGFGSQPVAQYVRDAEPPLLVVQVERGATHDPLEEILDPRLDVCFIGAVDLSVDLGVPGAVDSRAVRDRSDEIAAAAEAAGIALGQHAGASGFRDDTRYVTVGTDVAAMLHGLRELRT